MAPNPSDSKPRVPSDWAADAGFPEFKKISEEGDALKARFGQLGGSPPLRSIWRLAEAHGADLVMHEQQYVDADYRDEFAHFYASTFPPYPDRTERLHFLRKGGDQGDDDYLGFVSLRPVPKRPVGRTVIAPPPELAESVSCLAQCDANPYGLPFTAKGFPFIQQDFQYGVCAHASMWMVAHYYHLAFGHGRQFVSDMVASAALGQGMDRLTPSSGLTIPQMARVLREMKLPAIAYQVRRLDGLDSPETIACRYLNSRIPVIVITGEEPVRHAKVLIGYRREGDQIEYICHDDQSGPYQRTRRRSQRQLEGDDWFALLVPLVGRVYLSGESAERLGVAFFKTQAKPATTEEPAGPLFDVLDPKDHSASRVRSYVVRASEYKRSVAERGLVPEAARMAQRTHTSQWIWVVELQDREAARTSDKCVVAEIALDATSDPMHKNFLFASLPKKFMRWPQLGGNPRDFPIPAGVLARSGAAIHVAAL